MRVLRGWLPLRRKFPPQPRLLVMTTVPPYQPATYRHTRRCAHSYRVILVRMVRPAGLLQVYLLSLNSIHVDRSTSPSIHWMVPILAGVPFGAGVAQILQALTTYLMDTYPLYFASSVASTIVLRSCCGALFPLFSPAMFRSLGDQWAMSLFGFLALACMPIPVLFWVSHGVHPSFLLLLLLFLF